MMSLKYRLLLVFGFVCLAFGDDELKTRKKVLGDWPSSARNETFAGMLIKRLLRFSDSRIRPDIYGTPLRVGCDFFIASFGSVDAINMDFQVDVFFRQKWTDKRLAFSDQEQPVVVAGNYMNEIWHPDLYFPNEKSASFHEVLVTNKAMKIYPNGTVRYSARLTLKLSCPMVLYHFPMDYQKCYIKVSSFSYDTDEMDLYWIDNSPVEVDWREITLPQFTLQAISDVPCLEVFKTGTFPCLMVTFDMRRQFGFYLLQTYTPCTLLVILSWLSFWINKEAVPARITLGVTTVLAMATSLSNSSGAAMNVSYAKALDVWYAFCMLIVFGALVEYALVNVLYRRELLLRTTLQEEQPHLTPSTTKSISQDWGKNNKLKRQTTLNSVNEETEDDDEDSESIDMVDERTPSVHSRQPKKKPTYYERAMELVVYYLRIKPEGITADSVDQCSRIIFPASFGVFNFLYWCIYLQPKFFTQVVNSIGITT